MPTAFGRRRVVRADVSLKRTTLDAAAAPCTAGARRATVVLHKQHGTQQKRK
jgi:hypothetical protein